MFSVENRIFSFVPYQIYENPDEKGIMFTLLIYHTPINSEVGKLKSSALVDCKENEYSKTTVEAVASENEKYLFSIALDFHSLLHIFLRASMSNISWQNFGKKFKVRFNAK